MSAGDPIGSYRHTRQVQFYETDMAGMVHFSWYLRYMEEAEHALWRAAGLSIVPADHAVGFPRVSASIDYHAPLHFEDVIDIDIRVDAISARTIRYAAVIRRGEMKAATGVITAVCVDKHASPMRAVDIPDDIRRRFKVEPPGL